jgi:hypothetical protein
MLVELSVVEHRYHAVMEGLDTNSGEMPDPRCHQWLSA